MTTSASSLLSSADMTYANDRGPIQMSLTRLKTGSDCLRRGIQGQAAETLAGLPVAAAGSIPLFARACAVSAPAR